MPAIPQTLDDPLKWADWLEIYALEDKDLSSSIAIAGLQSLQISYPSS
jgi:hypothetical protein